MEIELRAEVDKSAEAKIISLGARFVSKKTEFDEYFKFSLDAERKLIIRLRSKNSKEHFLTFKGSSKHEEDIAWQEWETKINDPEGLKKLFLSNGLVEVVKIEKTRKTFAHDKFEINLDDIKDLGLFVEAELKSEDIASARVKLENLFFEKLGIAKESIIRKGYVPLMIEKNLANSRK